MSKLRASFCNLAQEICGALVLAVSRKLSGRHTSNLRFSLQHLEKTTISFLCLSLLFRHCLSSRVVWSFAAVGWGILFLFLSTAVFFHWGCNAFPTFKENAAGRCSPIPASLLLAPQMSFKACRIFSPAPLAEAISGLHRSDTHPNNDLRFHLCF